MIFQHVSDLINLVTNIPYLYAYRVIDLLYFSSRRTPEEVVSDNFEKEVVLGRPRKSKIHILWLSSAGLADRRTLYPNEQTDTE